MAIQVGDRLPDVILTHMTETGPAPISSGDLFREKRVVLFALPGAFTPTCSTGHLPGFVSNSYKLRQAGIDRIICLSVNDAYVMDAWAKDRSVGAAVFMAADGNGDFTRAVGMEEDRRGRGMGVRSRRYAMIADDGVVTHLNVEEPGRFEVSGADTVLELRR